LEGIRSRSSGEGSSMSLADPWVRDLGDVAVRLGVAVLVGGAIGLNRDLRGKPAGVRTHALVSLSSALVTLAGVLLGTGGPLDANPASRAIQGIITGIGFLGAGVILRPGGGRVRGLTTAATIWLAAGLGIASGAGYLATVVVATVLALIVLVGGGPVEQAFQRLFGRESRRNATPSSGTSA
jgi:putative Mg2+ transporter-C (MgtC) family protein